MENTPGVYGRGTFFSPKKGSITILICILVLFNVRLNAQDHKELVYKTIDTVSLSLHIMYPGGMEAGKSYPAIVFFSGGGWKGGSIRHFELQAKHLTERGLITIRADYRVERRHGTTPFESLMDAKSALRFIKKQADQLHIDTSMIAASGGSAGGHLAAATALIKDFNEEGDDLSVSPVPDALVLFNPVIDNGPAGYGFERVGEQYKAFSPLHNIRAGAPPTVIFLGTKDVLVPVETAEYYKVAMERVGSRCDLHLYEDQPHGFFNPSNPEYYKKTLMKADQFLVSLGYLENAGY